MFLPSEEGKAIKNQIHLKHGPSASFCQFPIPSPTPPPSHHHPVILDTSPVLLPTNFPFPHPPLHLHIIILSSWIHLQSCSPPIACSLTHPSTFTSSP